MGWQDRDYAQKQPFGVVRTMMRQSGASRFRSVAFILIGANVLIHIIAMMTRVEVQVGRYIDVQSPIHNWLEMSTPHVLRGQIWRLITSEYLHAGGMHLFVNMLGLYFLGPAIERTWGPKRFFIFYTVSGFLGNIFYLGLNVVNWLPNHPAVGASGCILGLLGAAAVLFPQAKVLVYFLFPVNIRTAALVFGVWYAYNLYHRGSNAGGDACHLVGLVFGYWWVRHGQQRWGMMPPIARAIPFKRTAKGRQVGFKERVVQRRQDAELIDRILTKVSISGLTSLSDNEKRALQEATQRQQAEDHRYGLD